ncbi:tyrosine-type recombinase/integrase [Tabrizicola sp. M-4]|uniref:tyrosine-type recombinase/integrase n=1 Tax=Tabrizicola sp. M-4 TaxID=3055847 RepID=UPI003DA8A68A
MALTDAQCRAAKASEKVQKLSDARGLFLQVTPGGSKLWRMNYRWQGKQRTAAFGAYPQVSLATARLRAAELKDKLAAGIDPALKEGATPAPQKPFKDAAREWFNAREATWVSGYANRIWARLQADIFPTIGTKDVSSITPAEILALLREVENRNALEMAKRLRQTLSAIFRFSVANGWATSDPAAPLAGALKSPPRQKHRAALKEGQLKEYFAALDAYSGDPATALGLRIIAHTFVRSSELRLATWDEFEGDTWRIPAEKMKMRKEHIVPLSSQVQDMFKELKELACGLKWVLPGQSGHKPISENTLIYGLYRMGYHSRASVHGFRSTASTILNESGLWRADAIERQLAHVPANEVRSAYNAALYLEERRRMMQWYSDFLDNKVKG